MTAQERLAILLATAATLVGQAHALPQGPQTVATSGANPTFTPGAGTLTIDQTAERTVIDWGSFSIAPNETVTFNLPGGTAIVVNRVPFCSLCSVPPPATVIDGALVSNGNVWLLDPRGVFFGPNAQVDVHGLLASPADLLDINAFVNGALGDPIAFDQTFGPASVSVEPGAQIVVRGGPAMFISSLVATGSGVRIGGSVQGGGTTEEQASSQVLYGAAQSFTLRFSATPPSPLGSTDLQLFDFIVDVGAPRTSFGSPSDVVIIGPGSVTRAGSVAIAGALGAPDGASDPARFRISGLLESTSGALIVNGAGGLVGGAPAGALADAEIDVLFDRVAFQVDVQGTPQIVLGPLVELRSAGGLDVIGRTVQSVQRFNAGGGQFPLQPVPDHLTVQFTNTSAAAGALLTVRARDDLFLTNAETVVAGPASNAIDLTSFQISVLNSMGSPTFGNATAQGSILAAQLPPPNGAPMGPGVDFAFGALTAGLSGSGTVSISTRGGVKTDAISASNISVSGDAFVSLGAVSAPMGSINLASMGNVSVGGATAQMLTVNTGPAGDVLFSGPIVLAGGPTSAPALQVFAGDAVTFDGAVSSVGDAFISAGGTVFLNAPFRVTGANGPSMTAAGVPTLGGFDLRAGDLDLNDTLFVRGVAGVGVNFALTDAGLGSGVNIENADIQRLDAPFVALRLSNSAAVVLEDLTLDATRIGQLILATNGVVRVQGAVTGVGAPELLIGEGALLPVRIEISGSLGTLGGPIGPVSLNSGGAILLGTPAFLTALQSASLTTVDLTQFGVGFGGAQANQLFLVAGPTTIAAQGAILQQNTGGLGFDGVRFTVPGGAVSGALGGAPTRIALFGQITDGGGVVVSGPPAASVSGLLANGVSPSNDYRFNSCVIGQTCAAITTTSFDPTSLKALPPPQPPPQDAGPGPASSQSQARRGANRTMSAIEVDSSESDLGSPDEAREERDPGVGAANEDLWPTPK